MANTACSAVMQKQRELLIAEHKAARNLLLSISLSLSSPSDNVMSVKITNGLTIK